MRVKHWIGLVLVPIGLLLFWIDSKEAPVQRPAQAPATASGPAFKPDASPSAAGPSSAINEFWVPAPNLIPPELPKRLRELPGTSLQLTVDPHDLQLGDVFELTFPNQPQTPFQLRIAKRTSLWGSTILRGTLLTPEGESAVLTLGDRFFSATFETPWGLREGFGQGRALWLYDPDASETEVSPEDFIIPRQEGET